MNPSLQIRVSQQLALSPQLQLSIRLLQLSTLELNQELEKYLLNNPLLERFDEDSTRFSGEYRIADADESGEANRLGISEPNPHDFDGEAPFVSHDWSESSAYSFSSFQDDEDGDFREAQSVPTSLNSHLVWQLGLTALSDRDNALVRMLIEALDDDGYLPQTLASLAEALPMDLEVSPEELAIALKHLQQFEPTGVGARSIQECLSLQLKALDTDPVTLLALLIVEQHIDLLVAHDFSGLCKKTGCTAAQLHAAHALILSMNPRPGAQYTPLETQYIVPDVIVKKRGGRWVVSNNAEAYPRLRVNRMYAEILSKQTSSALTAQLQEARWLIKNIEQRFDTILRVSQAIVDRQCQFFEHGEIAMRPMVLREIADLLGFHESTISRVTTQKYMATPRGVFELKYFFGSHVSTNTGSVCSSTAIRALIKQLVGSENQKKPLSDSQIADVLSKQGVVIARRTVAKYREHMNIPPVNLRKKL